LKKVTKKKQKTTREYWCVPPVARDQTFSANGVAALIGTAAGAAVETGAVVVLVFVVVVAAVVAVDVDEVGVFGS
jgi:hypothetical protein